MSQNTLAGIESTSSHSLRWWIILLTALPSIFWLLTTWNLNAGGIIEVMQKKRSHVYLILLKGICCFINGSLRIWFLSNMQKQDTCIGNPIDLIKINLYNKATFMSFKLISYIMSAQRFRRFWANFLWKWLILGFDWIKIYLILKPRTSFFLQLISNQFAYFLKIIKQYCPSKSSYFISIKNKI